MKNYYIHYNGSRPFKVNIDNNNKVEIYKEQQNHTDNYETESSFIFENPSTIFIGKCPRNSHFDGNSILLHLRYNKYIYIGSHIYSFEALSDISTFFSPVDKNDVPYPYAIDTDGRYYLLIENVVIKHVKNTTDPYIEYYQKSKITDVSMSTLCFQNIDKYYIGDKLYNLHYSSSPDKDYDRISTWSNFGNGMKIIYTNGESKLITRADYIHILEEFGKYNNWQKIITNHDFYT